MANKILHTTIMQKNTTGGKNIIYPKTVTKNIIDGSSTLDQTLNILKSPDVSNKITEFTQASIRENLESGETLATSHGKIMKLISDLKSLAYLDTVGVSNLDSTLLTAYNNRITSDKVTTSTSITTDGYVADARAVNNLQTQINTTNSNIGNIRYVVINCETSDHFGELKTRFMTDEFKSACLYYFRLCAITGTWYTVLGYKNGTNRANLIVMGYFNELKYLYYNNDGWTQMNVVTSSDIKNLQTTKTTGYAKLDTTYVSETGYCQYIQLNNTVSVKYYLPLTSSVNKLYSRFVLGTGLPKANTMEQLSSAVCIDHDYADGYMSVSTSGQFCVNVRNTSLSQKTILGGFTYICQ